MHFSSSTVLAFIGLTAAPAWALPHPFSTREENAGVFAVSSFYDTGSPHSTISIIRFNVSDTSAQTPVSNVECQASEGTDIATATFPTNCSDPTVFFGLSYANGNYFLQIAHEDAKGNYTDAGSISLGHDVYKVVDQLNPNGDYYELTYPTAFDVGYNRY